MVQRTVRIPGKHDHAPCTMSCYISVPAIAVWGTWSVQDLLTAEEIGALTRFTNRLESNR